MTLVFSTKLGQLIQTQFGVNEIAASVVVGKAVGSLLTRQSDAAVFAPLAKEYGIFMRRIPKYLETIKFDRSGTILGSHQRKIKATNTLEGVNLGSLEGIATFLTLILRHTHISGDVVDILEDLVCGKFWIAARTQTDDSGSNPLPYSLRAILRSFVTAVNDADADSPQLNVFRQSMCKLVETIGDSSFLDSIRQPTQNEQRRFVHRLLGSPQDHKSNEDCSDFDTFSAGATTIALAAAANGASLLVRCVTNLGTKVLAARESATRGEGSTFTFTLWLVPPPSAVSQLLGQMAPRRTVTSYLHAEDNHPILGGVMENIKNFCKASCL